MHPQNPFYIATSKGPGPTSLLLREMLGIDLPPDSPRIMASLIPPDTRKAEALRSASLEPRMLCILSMSCRR